MKKQLIILSLFLATFTFSFAEKKNGQEKIDKMLENRNSYIESKLSLTTEESKNFWPLYKEYQEKRMNLFEKNNLNRIGNDIEENEHTENEFQIKNEAFINNKINRAILDKMYYEKFKEILSESKIYNLYKVEKEYKKELLKQVENKGRSNQTNKRK